MRKFIVEVTEEFIFSIDETMIDKNLIPEFEEYIRYLEGDKFIALAKYIGENYHSARDYFFDGLGYIENDSFQEYNSNEVAQGLKIEIDFGKDEVIKVRELVESKNELLRINSSDEEREASSLDKVSELENVEQKEIEYVEKRKSIEIAKNLLDILDLKTISIKTGLTIEEVEKLR